MNYNYEDYLDSARWKKTSKIIKRVDYHTCQICRYQHPRWKSKSGIWLEAHHLSYARVKNEHYADLITLCSECHEAISDYEDNGLSASESWSKRAKEVKNALRETLEQAQQHAEKRSRGTNILEKLKTKRQLYQEYLRSEQWKNLREITLFLDSDKCQICGYKKDLLDKMNRLEVHHLTYENFGEERMQELITLCAWCHDAIETYHEQFNLPENEAWFKRAMEFENPVISNFYDLGCHLIERERKAEEYSLA